MRVRTSWVAAGVLGLTISSTSGSARAQPALETRIAELEARLAELSRELADLKALTPVAQPAPSPPPAPEPAAPVVTLSNARPTIASPDGSQSFAIRGLFQFDAAAYDEQSSLPGATDFNSGTNFRRARLGIEGRFAKDWSYALTGEFGGSGSEQVVLNQAYIEYGGWKPGSLANPIRLRIGAWATPTGLEDATSNTESLFLERPAVAELVRNLAGGDGRSGVGAFANGDRWYASAAFTGGVAGNAAEFDEQTGFLGRAAFSPIGSDDYALHLGANVSAMLDPADSAPALAVDQRLIRLRERPELRVDGTRLVDTGNIAADSVLAYGLEVGALWRNLLVGAEAFQIDVDRPGGPFDPSFGGWYAHLAWTLTGERRTWAPASGGFRGVRPMRPFDPENGGWGAWELAARYSVLDLNDGEGSPGGPALAGGIRGGKQEVTTFGLNWYPNNLVRFLLHYQWIEVDRLDGAGAHVGEDAEALSLRSQVAF